MVWIDKYRIFPRIVLTTYLVGCIFMVNWYLDFEVKYERACDPQVIELLLNKGYEEDKIEALACKIVSAVGQPNGYTALISAMFGAGAGIFGLYVNSGSVLKDP